MKLEDLIPDHAKRAAGFQKDAQALLNKNRNLVTREVHNSTTYTDDSLTGLGMMLPLSSMDQMTLNSMRETNDRNSAEETAIIVYASAVVDTILNQVADQLDQLAEKWQAMQEKHNTHDDIHPDEEGTEDDLWVLSTAYVFRDLA